MNKTNDDSSINWQDYIRYFDVKDDGINEASKKVVHSKIWNRIKRNTAFNPQQKSRLKEIESADWDLYIKFYGIEDHGIKTKHQAIRHWFGCRKNSPLLFTEQIKKQVSRPGILDRYKCVFIHIPKSAGSSMELALYGGNIVGFNTERQVWNQHQTIQQIKQFYAEAIQWNEYFKFAFVRNPFDRVVSSFNWLCFNKKIKTTPSSFRDFVFKTGVFQDLLNPEEMSKQDNRYHQVMPAANYICIDKKVAVDFVGKFETIQEDWNFVCKTLNVEMHLPCLKKMNHRPYKEYYNQETRQKVAENYAEDLDLFHYSFDDA